jgi:hypothetical protein
MIDKFDEAVNAMRIADQSWGLNGIKKHQYAGTDQW